MLAVDEQLAAELLAMKAEDLRVRDALARDGSLFEGYHSRMEEVHRRNAARLREIIAERGWPGQSLVGQQATEAAWMIVQHDIAEPQFLRDMLEIFRKEAARGELSAKWAATCVWNTPQWATRLILRRVSKTRLNRVAS